MCVQQVCEHGQAVEASAASSKSVPFDPEKHKTADLAFVLSGISIRSPLGGKRQVILPLMVSPNKKTKEVYENFSVNNSSSDVYFSDEELFGRCL